MNKNMAICKMKLLLKHAKSKSIFTCARFNAIVSKNIFILLILTINQLLTACSSPTARQQIEAKQARANPRAAAYAADGFTLDHRSPEPRPFRSWEFYFKHCNLVSRNPFPTQDEYACTEPF